MAIPEKNKHGVEVTKFPVVLKKLQRNFQRLIKNKVEFVVGDQESGISRGLGFRL